MDARIVRALVTGASAGLGDAFARQLAARGVELVLVARREQRLRELADTLPVPCEVIVADLADPSGRSTVEQRLRSPSRPVDLLVNNAGFGGYGQVATLDIDRQTAMIDTNITALTRLTRAVLPQLLDRGHGGVLNVGSIAGFQPAPHGAVYSATKAYVRSFTEALHEELRGTPVHVMLLAPGFTRTEFQAVADVTERAVPAIASRIDADHVVRDALDAYAAGRDVCVPGLGNRVASYASQVTPSALTRRVSGAVHARFVAR